MNDLIQRLHDWGCDTDCIATRFLGKEDFYLQMLDLGVADPNYPALKDAVAQGNVTSAFELSHTLKGTMGNLGITPAYTLICTMVERLRVGDGSKMAEDLAAFSEAFEKFVSIVKG